MAVSPRELAEMASSGDPPGRLRRFFNLLTGRRPPEGPQVFDLEPMVVTPDQYDFQGGPSLRDRMRALSYGAYEGSPDTTGIGAIGDSWRSPFIQDTVIPTLGVNSELAKVRPTYTKAHAFVLNTMQPGRVYVNPEVMGTTDQRAADETLTHELFHSSRELGGSAYTDLPVYAHLDPYSQYADKVLADQESYTGFEKHAATTSEEYLAHLASKAFSWIRDGRDPAEAIKLAERYPYFNEMVDFVSKRMEYMGVGDGQ